jgi:hypothetical protein
MMKLLDNRIGMSSTVVFVELLDLIHSTYTDKTMIIHECEYKRIDKQGVIDIFDHQYCYQVSLNRLVMKSN